LLSEERTELDGWKPHHIDFIGTIRQRYLLWGKRAEDPSGGWTRLTTARIGSINVPAVDGLRFQICALEYLSEYDDGNVAVAEERLLALEPFVPGGPDDE
jgi:CRISPR-associated protein (TIGR03984 family)